MGYPVWIKGADSVESGLGCTLLRKVNFGIFSHIIH